MSPLIFNTLTKNIYMYIRRARLPGRAVIKMYLQCISFVGQSLRLSVFSAAPSLRELASVARLREFSKRHVKDSVPYETVSYARFKAIKKTGG